MTLPRSPITTVDIFGNHPHSRTMAVVLAYLIVVVMISVVHGTADECEESSLVVGLVFPVIAAGVVAWLAVEAWDAARGLVRDLI